MKRYKEIVVSVASLLFLSGCYDLDRYPYDQVSSGTFWKTEGQAGHAIPGRRNSVLFDDSICRLQCRRCNIFMGGRWPWPETRIN